MLIALNQPQIHTAQHVRKNSAKNALQAAAAARLANHAVGSSIQMQCHRPLDPFSGLKNMAGTTVELITRSMGNIGQKPTCQAGDSTW